MFPPANTGSGESVLVTPRFANGVTDVVTELLLLLLLESAFSEAALAVLVNPRVFPILAVRVNCALAPLAKALMLQSTVPFCPTAGMLQLAPGPLS